MECFILSGANASGVIIPGPSQGIQVEGIELSIPLDEVGTTDPVVTLSGAISGAMSFHSSIGAKIRFYKDEQVVLTTTAFSGEYNAAIKYVVYGSQESYINTRNLSKTQLPSRLIAKL